MDANPLNNLQLELARLDPSGDGRTYGTFAQLSADGRDVVIAWREGAFDRASGSLLFTDAGAVAELLRGLPDSIPVEEGLEGSLWEILIEASHSVDAARSYVLGHHGELREAEGEWPDVPRIGWVADLSGTRSVVGTMTFAERLLVELDPECFGIDLDPGSEDDPTWLNEERVPAGHGFAILYIDGHTVATGETRESAIEAACLRVVRRMGKHADELDGRLIRMREAVRVLQAGGEE